MMTYLADVPVLFVMATEPEYGPALRARFTPLITGVGSAGSARLEQGGIYAKP